MISILIVNYISQPFIVIFGNSKDLYTEIIMKILKSGLQKTLSITKTFCFLPLLKNLLIIVSNIVLWMNAESISQVSIYLLRLYSYLLLLDLGNVWMWTRKGQKAVYRRHKHYGAVKKSFSVFLMTNLGHNPGILWSIFPGTGNGERFVAFIRDCLPFMMEGQTLFVDNVNFYVKDWSADTVKSMLEANGIAYYV